MPSVGAVLPTDQAREMLAELVKAKTAWIAKVPAAAAPAAIRELADEPLAAAADTVRAVKFAFSGTMPPPPWPAGPDLVAARARLQAMRDGADAMERKGVAVSVNPRALVALRGAGAAVYDRAMELLKRFIEAPRLPDLLKLVPDPRSVLAGIPVYLVVGVLLYLVAREEL